MKVVVMAMTLCLQVILLQAQSTIYSQGSGNWNQSSSWDGNRIPRDNDIIVIRNGHILQLSGDVSLKNVTLRVIGELNLSAGADLLLNSASVVNVISGGKIRAQAPNDPAAILLGGAAKFRGGKVFNANWGPGVLNGLAYATSSTGNIDQYGSGFIIGNLPSVWQDLKLYLTPDNLVQLVWITSHETGSRIFHIEKSMQGQSWSTIGTIESAGNMSYQNIYNFVDNSPGNGQVYYRIRELDPDGQVKLSSVRSVRVEDINASGKIFPNPAQNIVQVNFQKAEKGTQISVYDMMGRIMQRSTVPEGSTLHFMDVSNWLNGTYILQISDGGGAHSNFKLVKY